MGVIPTLSFPLSQPSLSQHLTNNEHRASIGKTIDYLRHLQGCISSGDDSTNLFLLIGQHVEPVVITAASIEDYSHLFDQVDQDGLYSSNTDFDATPQSQYIYHSEALLHGGGVVATQTYSEAKQMRQYKRWTHEEMSKLLGAIYEFRQSRYLWTDVKNNHFSADIERSANSLKQKFKEMCKAAATSSGVKDPKTNELYDLALMLRGEIQQKKCFKKSFTGN